MTLRVRLYLAFVALGALSFPLSGLMTLNVVEYGGVLFLLTASSFFSQVYELEILPRWFLSTNVAVVMSAIFIGGLPLSLWVAVLATVPAELVLRWDYFRTNRGRFIAPVVFNTGQLIVSIGIAAITYESIIVAMPVVYGEFLAMTTSFLVLVVLNNSLVAGMLHLHSGESFLRVLRTALKNLHLQFSTMGVLAALMATLYEASIIYLILAFVPLSLVHYSTRNYLRLRRESHLAFKRITDMLAERDEYTGTHSQDVEELAVRLAEEMKLSDEELEAVRAGAAIHDIGKIAIPDRILKKLGPLNDEEFEIMKQHTIIGAKILSNMEIYRDVVPIVRHEHEHWDGSGYPDGLEGDSIPMGARIVAVADVYSALTTERPYRISQGKPLSYPSAEACRILNQMAGTVLDPTLTKLFVELIQDGDGE